MDLRIKVNFPQMIDWSSILERLPVYIFPGFLVLAEWILRSTSSLDTETFIGPTLAAVGIGYIVPLTIEKKRNYPQSVIDVLKQEGLTARPLRETHFIALCWVSIIVFTGLWLLSVYLSAKHSREYWWALPLYYYPGIVNYLGGFLLSEIREVI